MPHGITSDFREISSRVHNFQCKHTVYTQTFLDELGCNIRPDGVQRKSEVIHSGINRRADPPDSASPALAKSPCFVHHAPLARQSSPPRSRRHAHPLAK